MTKLVAPFDNLENPVLFEAFEWYLPSDSKHWSRLRIALPSLKAIGITHLWLPPGSKAKDVGSNGYDIYDAYDLGEFHQKGTIDTKWGSKQELMTLASESQRLGMGIIWDAVLNHRAWGDGTESVKVVEVNPNDRRVDITGAYDIKAWTKFDFVGRNGKYSSFKYNKSHFNGTDWNENNKTRAIYRFVENGKQWAADVGTFQGNADYLMLENLDYSNQDLVKETNAWGRWIVRELGLSGFRLDAAQHYSRTFANDWSRYLRKASGKDLLFLGEYWHGDVRVLTEWLANMSPFYRLFDVPLFYNIARLSWFKGCELKDVFEGSLVKIRPNNAVTFIQCHDTQTGQAMDTPINRAFSAHAYALLLLRQEGFPCVFFGDLYGLGFPYPEPPTCDGKLPDLILARKLFAYGRQVDYFDKRDCIGWVRHGVKQHPNGLALIMSWTKETRVEDYSPRLSMNVGKQHARERWSDVLGQILTAVVIDDEGYGNFPCTANGLSCFVNKEARGSEQFPVQFNTEFNSLLT